MQTVDSNQQKLSTNEVIEMFAKNQDLGDIPYYAAMLGFVKESSLPNTEVIQFGNTVFISHFSEDGTKVVMRTLNVDVGNNLIENAKQYAMHLVSRGVEELFTQFDDPSFINLIKIIERFPVTDQQEVFFGQNKQGKYQMLIKFNQELI